MGRVRTDLHWEVEHGQHAGHRDHRGGPGADTHTSQNNFIMIPAVIENLYSDVLTWEFKNIYTVVKVLVNKNTVKTVTLWNSFTILKQLFSMWIYVKLSFISVMRSCIFSIISAGFSVTWSSEIILICWFTAQETFLIIINVFTQVNAKLTFQKHF